MVTITLKKASVLAGALAGKSVPVAAVVMVSLYGETPSTDAVGKAQREFKDATFKQLSILDAVQAIRSLIGKANEGDINKLIGDRVVLKKQIEFLSTITIRKEATDVNAFTKRLASLASAPAPSYGKVLEHISYELETASTVEPLLSDAKRMLIKVEDELTSLNFSTKIELPTNVVDLLIEFDLI